jgi:hypothetical protein
MMAARNQPLGNNETFRKNKKTPKEKSKMNKNTFEIPLHEQIERRAYQIYLEHGFHPGNDLADWLAAEKELTEQSEAEAANKPPAVLRKSATA